MMDDQPTLQISIAICTYNRSKYLKPCLESIKSQVQKYKDVEVLVIDNNSDDNTKEVCESMMDDSWTLRYEFEKEQGLSYARNKAIEVSKAEWIAYLDDDATAYPDYLDRMKYIIDNYDFDCFGGMYYAFYETEKPKWLSDSFGTKRKLTDEVAEIKVDYLSGGNLVCKRLALIDIKGFPVDLGMKGNKIGYGEEDKMQSDLRSKNYKIGFDPELKIDHLVASYKLKPHWHVKRMYQMHKNTQNEKSKQYNMWFTLKRILLITLTDVPRFLKLFFTRKDFYRQNLYINVMSKYAVTWGYFRNVNKNR
ncbi:MAG: glycosyltransferase family 2 protein [Flavobacteriaceae bacterium]|nr:glycosyltransferase family 2 protein [Flavobacteriaceae bacterium]